MNHTAFFETVKSGNIGTCYLFEGVEEYIRAQALKALYDALLPAGLEAMNLTELVNPQADELIAACETLPFMGERRVVVVREYSLLTGSGEERDPEQVIEYLEHPAPTVCLIFYVKDKADGRKKLYTVLKKKNAVVDFSTLSDDECARWIRATVKKYGKSISGQAAAGMAFMVGKDTALLSQEIAKVCAYIGERDAVTAQDMEEICTRSTECSVFQMVDAQADGRYDRAFFLLNDMLRNGEERMMVLSLLLRQYRILYHMSCLTRDRVPSASLPGLLGIPPFAVNNARRQAARYSTERLKAAYDWLLDYETRIKQGRASQDHCAENALLFLKHILEGERE